MEKEVIKYFLPTMNFIVRQKDNHPNNTNKMSIELDILEGDHEGDHEGEMRGS